MTLELRSEEWVDIQCVGGGWLFKSEDAKCKARAERRLVWLELRDYREEW